MMLSRVNVMSYASDNFDNFGSHEPFITEKYLYVIGTKGFYQRSVLVILDKETLLEVAHISLDSNGDFFVYDDNHIAVSRPYNSGGNNTIDCYIYSIDNGILTQTLHTNYSVINEALYIACTASHMYVYVDYKIYVVDISTGETVQTINGVPDIFDIDIRSTKFCTSCRPGSASPEVCMYTINGDGSLTLTNKLIANIEGLLYIDQDYNIIISDMGNAIYYLTPSTNTFTYDILGFEVGSIPSYAIPSYRYTERHGAWYFPMDGYRGDSFTLGIYKRIYNILYIESFGPPSSNISAYLCYDDNTGNIYYIDGTLVSNRITVYTLDDSSNHLQVDIDI